MATKQRGKKKGVTTITQGSAGAKFDPEAIENRNETRREKYANDSEFAQKTKQQARNNYRKENPKKNSKLGKGRLLISGVEKEVYISGDLYTLIVYTVPRAAAALGKTEVTFKRWIKDKMLPQPIAMDAVKGYKHYTKGELKLISEIIAKHEKDFVYFHTTHTQTIEELWQALEAYRRT